MLVHYQQNMLLLNVDNINLLMNLEKVMKNKIRILPQITLFEDMNLIIAVKYKEKLLKFYHAYSEILENQL